MRHWKRRGVLSGICAATIAPFAARAAASSAGSSLFSCQGIARGSGGAYGDALVLISNDKKWAPLWLMYKSASLKPTVGTLVKDDLVLGIGEATLAILLVPSANAVPGRIETALALVRVACPFVGDSTNTATKAMTVTLKFGDFAGSVQVDALDGLDRGAFQFPNGATVDFVAREIGSRISEAGRKLSPEETQALDRAAFTQSSAVVEVKSLQGTMMYSLDFTLDPPATRATMIQSALESAAQATQDLHKNCMANPSTVSAWTLD